MWLDLVVVSILLASAVVAFMRGFTREVLTIFALIGAVLAALFGGPELVPVTTGWLVDPAVTTPQKLFGIVPYPMLAIVLAYVLVFVVVLGTLSVLSHFVSRAIHSIGLGPVDRSLGVVFGLVRGIVLVGILYLPVHVVLSDEQRQAWFGDAHSLVYVTYTAELMQAFLPGKDILAKDDVAEAADTAGPATEKQAVPAIEPAGGSSPAAGSIADPLRGLTGEAQ